MDWFSYHGDDFFAEKLPVTDLAKQFGTPLYVYSKAALEAGYNAYQQPLRHIPHLICYAVKANSNIAVLNVLAKMGAGFDIVSIGELERVLVAGGDPAKVVFSGIGKQCHEIRRALEVGIHCFNIESEAELERIESIAQSLKKTASISLRVNPDVNAQTHPYISTGLKDNKFGINANHALTIYQKASNMRYIDPIGIDCHIGSQITDKKPFLEALDCLLGLIDQLKEQGIHLNYIDIGGGLGIRYKDEKPPSPASYLTDVIKKLEGMNMTLIVEPGRSIAGEAGLLLTRVELIKHNNHKSFAITDAAMNDQLRPAMYGAWHDIIPTKKRSTTQVHSYDIVGPVCETGDFLGKARALQIQENDLLAILCTGAYGFVMSSNYNSRNRSAEVMIDQDRAQIIRRRETIEEQIAPETLFFETE